MTTWAPEAYLTAYLTGHLGGNLWARADHIHRYYHLIPSSPCRSLRLGSGKSAPEFLREVRHLVCSFLDLTLRPGLYPEMRHPGLICPSCSLLPPWRQ